MKLPLWLAGVLVVGMLGLLILMLWLAVGMVKRVEEDHERSGH